MGRGRGEKDDLAFKNIIQNWTGDLQYWDYGNQMEWAP